MTQLTTIDTIAMWLGYGVMLTGGIGILFMLAWWAFDVIAIRLGWLRMFHQYTRIIISAERKDRD